MANKIAELEKLAYTAANGNMSRSQAKAWASKVVAASRGLSESESSDDDTLSNEDWLSLNLVVVDYLRVASGS